MHVWGEGGEGGETKSSLTSIIIIKIFKLYSMVKSALPLVWYKNFPTHHIEEAESPPLKQRLARETIEKRKPKLYKN